MNKNCFLVLLCCLLFSCNDQPVYNHFQTIEKGLWEKEEEVIFTFEIEDVKSPYQLTLELRNNNIYPFQNIWISLEEFQADSTSRKDTISITLADPYGRWSGNGISLFETEFPLYSTYYFQTPGIYTYKFKHLMYKNPLPGIQDIGLRVEKEPI